MSTELPDEPDGDDPGEYDAMLDQLDMTIDTLAERIENGRIRDHETEKVRIKQYRCMAYLIKTKRQVLEDKTLDELAEEVEELREAKNDTVAVRR